MTMRDFLRSKVMLIALLINIAIMMALAWTAHGATNVWATSDQIEPGLMTTQSKFVACIEDWRRNSPCPSRPLLRQARAGEAKIRASTASGRCAKKFKQYKISQYHQLGNAAWGYPDLYLVRAYLHQSEVFRSGAVSIRRNCGH